MGKILNNENGFSAVEAILVLVIVVLIGGVGYIVYNNYHKTTTASVTAKTITPMSAGTKPNTATQPASSSVQLSPDGPSIHVPKDWQFTQAKCNLQQGVGLPASTPNVTCVSYATLNPAAVTPGSAGLAEVMVLRSNASSQQGVFAAMDGSLCTRADISAFSVSGGYQASVCRTVTGDGGDYASNIYLVQKGNTYVYFTMIVKDPGSLTGDTAATSHRTSASDYTQYMAQFEAIIKTVAY